MTRPLDDRGWLHQCDRCQIWVPRAALLRQTDVWRAPAGANYILHSSYDGTFWTCSGVDLGDISMANTGFWIELVESGGVTTATSRGVQTWGGDGALESQSGTDLTGWDSLVIEARCGRYQADTGTLTVAVQVDGVTRKTWSIKANTRIWGAVAHVPGLADPSSVTFGFDVTTPTGDEGWWVEDIQLHKDLVVPPRMPYPISTTGAAVVHSAPFDVVGQPALCSKCRRHERLNLVHEPAPGVFEPDEMPEIKEDTEVI